MDFRSDNLTIPRGKVLFARYLPGTTTPGPYQDLGNCPEFSLSQTSRKVTTYDSVAGRLVQRDEFVLANEISATITTDDIGAANQKLWFSSGTTTTTNVAYRHTFNKSFDIPLDGQAVDIGEKHIRVLAVTDNLGVVWVKDIDYTVDEVNGLLQIRNFLTSKPATSINVNFRRWANIVSEIEFDTLDAEGELRFVSYNPFGPKQHFVFPRVRLSPVGSFDLITEQNTWASLSFTMNALLKQGERRVMRIAAAPVKVMNAGATIGPFLLGDTVPISPVIVEGAQVALRVLMNGIDVTASVVAGNYTPTEPGILTIISIVDTGYDAHQYTQDVTISVVSGSVLWGSTDIRFSNNAITFGTV